MRKYKDIIIKIIEEYIELKIGKNDEKSMGRRKGRSKSSSKES